MNPSQQVLLLVDDNDDDVALATRAFSKARLANPIQRCSSGDQALDYLFRRGPFADPASSPRPSMVLLDLNMPGTSGREVLAAIRADPDLRVLPVVVLTTSNDPRDIEVCYQMGANSYIQKPVGLENFVQAIQRLKDYWFEIVLLPNARHP